MVSHAAHGAIFETRVVSEALKDFHGRGVEPDICSWRDSVGHEIDLPINQAAKQIPLELKSGQTIASDFFDYIDHWRNWAGQAEGVAASVAVATPLMNAGG